MGHIVTGNLKIITDSRIRSVISKGTKYKFQAHTDFIKSRETIVSALKDYCTRWCKREHVQSNAYVICYKYNKPICNNLVNFNKLVYDLDIEVVPPDS